MAHILVSITTWAFVHDLQAGSYSRVIKMMYLK